MLIGKDYECSLITSTERRDNFSKYVSEIVKPTSQERQQLLQNFLDALYSLRPYVVFDLVKRLEDLQREFFQNNHWDDVQWKARHEEMVKLYPKYYNALNHQILRTLKIGNKNYNTEERAKRFVRATLSTTDAPLELLKDLEEQFLGVWRIKQNCFLLFRGHHHVFGSLGRGDALLRWTARCTYRVQREQALTRLMFGKPVTSEDRGSLGLRYVLLLQDIRSATDRLMSLAPSDQDELSLGQITVFFERNSPRESGSIVVTSALRIRDETSRETYRCSVVEPSLSKMISIDGKSFLEDGKSVTEEEVVRAERFLGQLQRVGNKTIRRFEGKNSLRQESFLLAGFHSK